MVTTDDLDIVPGQGRRFLDRLPATATPDAVLRVATDLEQLEQWQLAEPWYAAAAQRWPAQAVFALGIANTRYARGELVAAEQSYRDVIKTFPDDAAAFNNLAWMLAEQQRWDEAGELIAAGLALAGPLQAELQDTEKFIRCRGRAGCE